MGYLTSDKPYPRGEIVARTGRMTPGYYGDPEATAERFVTVGGLQFFRTGDIGEMVDGQFKVCFYSFSFVIIAFFFYYYFFKMYF